MAEATHVLWSILNTALSVLHTTLPGVPPVSS